MSNFLATSIVPRVDLYLLRRDYFDGLSLLLQDSDGLPFDLNELQVCSSVWKQNASGGYDLITSVNVEEQEPLSEGRVRLWLSSAQTAAIWDVYEGSTAAGGVFFPTAYSSDTTISSSLLWDVRIEKQEYLANLVSVSAGAFVSQTNHTLASSERAFFSGTSQSSLNYNGTSARIYSGMTNITYQPPYSFTVPALSGITDAAIGGSVYRLKQDTVVAGSVIVGTTLSNCFP
jgi:hypothetical protein